MSTRSDRGPASKGLAVASVQPGAYRRAPCSVCTPVCTNETVLNVTFDGSGLKLMSASTWLVPRNSMFHSIVPFFSVTLPERGDGGVNLPGGGAGVLQQSQRCSDTPERRAGPAREARLANVLP